MSRDPRIDSLERRIETLRREYDLFLSGQRKAEPYALSKEIEDELMLLIRTPTISTVFKFQVRMLALRFRALGTQVRNLLELKAQRKSSGAPPIPDPLSSPPQPSMDIVVDAEMLHSPSALSIMVRKLLERTGLDHELPAGVTPEGLSATMAKKAASVIGKSGVQAVRYSIVPGSHGPRVKGEPVYEGRRISNAKD